MQEMQVVKVSKELDAPVQLSDIQNWTVKKNGTPQANSIKNCYSGAAFGLFGSGHEISKTYQNLPPHWSISVQLTAYILWNWNNHEFQVKIDNTLLYKQSFKYNQDPIRTLSSQNNRPERSMCEGGNGIDTHGGFFPMTFNATHTDNQGTLKIDSTLTGDIGDRAFMISNVYIYIDTCHFSCLTCNGPAYNQCTSCPTGAQKYGGVCRCPFNQRAHNYQCIQSCPLNTVEDNISRTCNEQCDVENCQSCSKENYCSQCISPFKLLRGKCYDRCPHYTTSNSNSCIDNTMSSLIDPELILEDFINVKFTTADVQKNSYDVFPQDINVASGLSSTNYAFPDCAGESYALGMGYHHGNCQSGCYLGRQFKFPPHYKLGMKLKFFAGDSWNGTEDGDILMLQVDGVDKLTKQYDYWPNKVDYNGDGPQGDGWKDEQFKNICGVFDNFNDQFDNIVVAPFNHNEIDSNIKIKFILNSNQWNEWGGIREMMIYVDKCTELCSTCSNRNGCLTCIDTRKNPPSCNQPDDGYWDDGNGGSGDKKFPKCDSECATCSNSADNCTQCKDPNASLPQCGKVTDCLNQVRVESAAQHHGDYLKVYIDTVLQSYTFNQGIGIVLFNDKGEFVEYKSYNTYNDLGEVNDMTTYINAIAAGRRVLVGIKGEGSYELHPPAYAALQSLGLDPTVKLGLYDSFAMIGQKGANSSTILQRIKKYQVGKENATVEECLMKCYVRCESCEVRSDNCIACKSPWYLYDNGSAKTCESSCPAKYVKVDSPKRICAKCPDNCQNCTTPLQCSVCENGYYVQGGQCIQCQHPCVNCTSATVCVGTCAPNLANRKSAPTCKCNDSYYEDNTKTCILCPAKFAKCNSPTDPIECKGMNRKNDLPNKCPCNDGYYDDNVNANCVLCQSPCVNCSSPSTCTSCKDGDYLNGNTCLQCPAKFAKCNSPTDPIECKGNNRKNDLPNKCPCNDGYYDDGTNANCVQCQSPCANCSAPTTCTSCVDGYYLLGNNCIQCPAKFAKCNSPTDPIECKGMNRKNDLPNLCPCNDGYYDDNANANCVKCQSPCLYCSAPSICTSCVDGYYLDGNNCTQCPAKFAKCNSPTDPTQCKGMNRKNDIPNKCPCNDGYYDDNANANCVLCQSPCVNCSGVSTCTSCKDGDYLNGNTCLQCPAKFAKCNSPTDPIECKGTNRKNDVPNKCPCNDGYYDDGTNANCVQCQSPCANCSAPTTCTSCVDGYYLLGNNCIQCPAKFAKCNSPTDPIECKGMDRKNDIPNKCPCNDGYYDDNINANCIQCKYPCQNCSDENTCTSCKTTLNRNNIPKCDCKLGYTDIGASCQKCNIKCYDCGADPNTCLSKCSHPTRDFTNNCKCLPGYEENPEGISQACTQIVQCQYQCLECKYQSSNCTKCQSGIGRSMDIPKCGCLEKYYDDGSIHCKQCPSQCKACNNVNECTQCLTDDVLLPLCKKEAEGNFSMPIVSGNIVSKCDTKCLKCSQNQSNCTKCRQSDNRSLIAPLCSCEPGFHDENGTLLDCIACPPQCLECISNTQCTSCRQDQHRELNKFNQTCDCMRGYLENGDLQCQKCYTYKGDCYLKCPPNTKQNNIKYVCEQLDNIFLDNALVFILMGLLFLIIQVAAFSLFRYKTAKNQSQFLQFARNQNNQNPYQEKKAYTKQILDSTSQILQDTEFKNLSYVNQQQYSNSNEQSFCVISEEA